MKNEKQTHTHAHWTRRENWPANETKRKKIVIDTESKRAAKISHSIRMRSFSVQIGMVQSECKIKNEKKKKSAHTHRTAHAAYW